MPRSANRPNKVGEHQQLKGGKVVVTQEGDDEDDARTERFTNVQEAFDEAQQRFGDATGQS